ncbi:MAG: molybdenum ABC transporter permease subunit [Opitutales bacterium TMED158]|nr:MAG: molybdenum ABC transporter permease subunit [Opitutales bacterium TMED158]
MYETVLSTLLWAAISCAVVAVPGVGFAYVLARRSFFGKSVLSTLTTLPLVLPPTAVGYLLLRLLANDGWLGDEVIGIDLGILLTWKAVIVACSVMSFPLFVRTARVAFEEVEPRLESMSRSLGMGPWQTFQRVTLPLASRGLIAAALLAFTRSLGEFGATIIIAGNIPGQTQTLASALFSAQQAGNDARANHLLWVALLVGFATVYLTERLTRKGGDR